MDITIRIPDGVVEAVAEAVRGNTPTVPSAAGPRAEGEVPLPPSPQEIIEESIRNYVASLYGAYEGQRAAEDARIKAEENARDALKETSRKRKGSHV